MRLRSLLVLVAFLALTACQRQEVRPGSPIDSSIDLSPWATPTFGPLPELGEDPNTWPIPADLPPLLQPNPILAQLDLEPGLSVSQEIGPQGGTLVAQAADGTRFTLVIPENGLLEPETITLTPARAVSGLPLSGGVLGTVQLEPIGLSFWEPAQLTIEPGQAFAADNLIAFMIDARGEAYMVPHEFAGEAFTIRLSHFSSGGGGQGSQSDAAEWQQRPPSEAEAQIAQEVKAVSDLANEIGDTSLASDHIREKLFRIYRAYFYRIVEPRLIQATSDDAMLESAVGSTMRWSHDLAVLGFREGVEGEFREEWRRVYKLVPRAFRNAVDRSYDRCVNESRPDMASRMYWIMRAIRKLGDSLGDLSGLGEQASINVFRCLRFELRFESRIEYLMDLCPGAAFAFAVRAKVQLAMDTETSRDGIMLAVVPDSYSGGAPLEFVSKEYNFCPDPTADINCPVTSIVARDSRFTVPHAEIDYRLNDPERSPGKPAIKILANLGDPYETITYTCPGGVQLTLARALQDAGSIVGAQWFAPRMWMDAFIELHRDHYEDPSGWPGWHDQHMFRFDDWEKGNGRLYAHKTYEKQADVPWVTEEATWPVWEVTTLELWHTPK